MIIKDKFELLNKTPNLLNVPKSSLATYSIDENSPRHIFTILELKKRTGLMLLEKPKGQILILLAVTFHGYGMLQMKILLILMGKVYQSGI